jgi:hypothetical protein
VSLLGAYDDAVAAAALKTLHAVGRFPRNNRELLTYEFETPFHNGNQYSFPVVDIAAAMLSANKHRRWLVGERAPFSTDNRFENLMRSLSLSSEEMAKLESIALIGDNLPSLCETMSMIPENYAYRFDLLWRLRFLRLISSADLTTRKSATVMLFCAVVLIPLCQMFPSVESAMYNIDPDFLLRTAFESIQAPMLEDDETSAGFHLTEALRALGLEFVLNLVLRSQVVVDDTFQPEEIIAPFQRLYACLGMDKHYSASSQQYSLPLADILAQHLDFYHSLVLGSADTQADAHRVIVRAPVDQHHSISISRTSYKYRMLFLETLFLLFLSTPISECVSSLWKNSSNIYQKVFSIVSYRKQVITTIAAATSDPLHDDALFCFVETQALSLLTFMFEDKSKKDREVEIARTILTRIEDECSLLKQRAQAGGEVFQLPNDCGRHIHETDYSIIWFPRRKRNLVSTLLTMLKRFLVSSSNPATQEILFSDNFCLVMKELFMIATGRCSSILTLLVMILRKIFSRDPNTPSMIKHFFGNSLVMTAMTAMSSRSIVFPADLLKEYVSFLSEVAVYEAGLTMILEDASIKIFQPLWNVFFTPMSYQSENLMQARMETINRNLCDLVRHNPQLQTRLTETYVAMIQRIARIIAQQEIIAEVNPDRAPVLAQMMAAMLMGSLFQIVESMPETVTTFAEKPIIKCICDFLVYGSVCHDQSFLSTLATLDLSEYQQLGYYPLVLQIYDFIMQLFSSSTADSLAIIMREIIFGLENEILISIHRFIGDDTSSALSDWEIDSFLTSISQVSYSTKILLSSSSSSKEIFSSNPRYAALASLFRKMAGLSTLFHMYEDGNKSRVWAHSSLRSDGRMLRTCVLLRAIFTDHSYRTTSPVDSPKEAGLEACDSLLMIAPKQTAKLHTIPKSIHKPSPDDRRSANVLELGTVLTAKRIVHDWIPLTKSSSSSSAPAHRDYPQFMLRTRYFINNDLYINALRKGCEPQLQVIGLVPKDDAEKAPSAAAIAPSTIPRPHPSIFRSGIFATEMLFRTYLEELAFDLGLYSLLHSSVLTHVKHLTPRASLVSRLALLYIMAKAMDKDESTFELSMPRKLASSLLKDDNSSNDAYVLKESSLQFAGAAADAVVELVHEMRSQSTDSAVAFFYEHIHKSIASMIIIAKAIIHLKPHKNSKYKEELQEPMMSLWLQTCVTTIMKMSALADELLQLSRAMPSSSTDPIRFPDLLCMIMSLSSIVMNRIISMQKILPSYEKIASTLTYLLPVAPNPIRAMSSDQESEEPETSSSAFSLGKRSTPPVRKSPAPSSAQSTAPVGFPSFADMLSKSADAALQASPSPLSSKLATAMNAEKESKVVENSSSFKEFASVSLVDESKSNQQSTSASSTPAFSIGKRTTPPARRSHATSSAQTTYPGFPSFAEMLSKSADAILPTPPTPAQASATVTADTVVPGTSPMNPNMFFTHVQVPPFQASSANSTSPFLFSPPAQAASPPVSWSSPNIADSTANGGAELRVNKELWNDRPTSTSPPLAADSPSSPSDSAADDAADTEDGDPQFPSSSAMPKKRVKVVVKKVLREAFGFNSAAANTEGVQNAVTASFKSFSEALAKLAADLARSCFLATSHIISQLHEYKLFKNNEQLREYFATNREEEYYFKAMEKMDFISFVMGKETAWTMNRWLDSEPKIDPQIERIASSCFLMIHNIHHLASSSVSSSSPLSSSTDHQLRSASFATTVIELKNFLFTFNSLFMQLRCSSDDEKSNFNSNAKVSLSNVLITRACIRWDFASDTLSQLASFVAEYLAYYTSSKDDGVLLLDYEFLSQALLFLDESLQLDDLWKRHVSESAREMLPGVAVIFASKIDELVDRVHRHCIDSYQGAGASLAPYDETISRALFRLEPPTAASSYSSLPFQAIIRGIVQLLRKEHDIVVSTPKLSDDVLERLNRLQYTAARLTMHALQTRCCELDFQTLCELSSFLYERQPRQEESCPIHGSFINPAVLFLPSTIANYFHSKCRDTGYDIAQEHLNNLIKHESFSSIFVSLISGSRNDVKKHFPETLLQGCMSLITNMRLLYTSDPAIYTLTMQAMRQQIVDYRSQLSSPDTNLMNALHQFLDGDFIQDVKDGEIFYQLFSTIIDVYTNINIFPSSIPITCLPSTIIEEVKAYAQYLKKEFLRSLTLVTSDQKEEQRDHYESYLLKLLRHCGNLTHSLAPSIRDVYLCELLGYDMDQEVIVSQGESEPYLIHMLVSIACREHIAKQSLLANYCVSLTQGVVIFLRTVLVLAGSLRTAILLSLRAALVKLLEQLKTFRVNFIGVIDEATELFACVWKAKHLAKFCLSLQHNDGHESNSGYRNGYLMPYATQEQVKVAMDELGFDEILLSFYHHCNSELLEQISSYRNTDPSYLHREVFLAAIFNQATHPRKQRLDEKAQSYEAAKRLHESVPWTKIRNANLLPEHCIDNLEKLVRYVGRCNIAPCSPPLRAALADMATRKASKEKVPATSSNAPPRITKATSSGDFRIGFLHSSSSQQQSAQSRPPNAAALEDELPELVNLDEQDTGETTKSDPLPTAMTGGGAASTSKNDGTDSLPSIYNASSDASASDKDEDENEDEESEWESVSDEDDDDDDDDEGSGQHSDIMMRVDDHDEDDDDDDVDNSEDDEWEDHDHDDEDSEEVDEEDYSEDNVEESEHSEDDGPMDMLHNMFSSMFGEVRRNGLPPGMPVLPRSRVPRAQNHAMVDYSSSEGASQEEDDESEGGSSINSDSEAASMDSTSDIEESSPFRYDADAEEEEEANDDVDLDVGEDIHRDLCLDAKYGEFFQSIIHHFLRQYAIHDAIDQQHQVYSPDRGMLPVNVYSYALPYFLSSNHRIFRQAYSQAMDKDKDKDTSMSSASSRAIVRVTFRFLGVDINYAETVLMTNIEDKISSSIHELWNAESSVPGPAARKISWSQIQAIALAPVASLQLQPLSPVPYEVRDFVFCMMNEAKDVLAVHSVSTSFYQITPRFQLHGRSQGNSSYPAELQPEIFHYFFQAIIGLCRGSYNQLQGAVLALIMLLTFKPGDQDANLGLPTEIRVALMNTQRMIDTMTASNPRAQMLLRISMLESLQRIHEICDDFYKAHPALAVNKYESFSNFFERSLIPFKAREQFQFDLRPDSIVQMILRLFLDYYQPKHNNLDDQDYSLRSVLTCLALDVANDYQNDKYKSNQLSDETIMDLLRVYFDTARSHRYQRIPAKAILKRMSAFITPESPAIWNTLLIAMRDKICQSLDSLLAALRKSNEMEVSSALDMLVASMKTALRIVQSTNKQLESKGKQLSKSARESRLNHILRTWHLLMTHAAWQELSQWLMTASAELLDAATLISALKSIFCVSSIAVLVNINFHHDFGKTLLQSLGLKKASATDFMSMSMSQEEDEENEDADDEDHAGYRLSAEVMAGLPQPPDPQSSSIAISLSSSPLLRFSPRDTSSPHSTTAAAQALASSASPTSVDTVNLGREFSVPGQRFRPKNIFDYLYHCLEESICMNPTILRLHELADRHRKVINQYLHQHPHALESSFLPFLAFPELRKLLDFDTKRKFFYQWIDNLSNWCRWKRDHRGEDNEDGDEDEDDYDEEWYDEDRLEVDIQDRSKILELSRPQLEGIATSRLLCNTLSVTFGEEEGIDAGGLTNEWNSIVCREMFREEHGLFVLCGNGLSYQPNPNNESNIDKLSYFNFIGVFVGKALVDRILLDAHFSAAFNKHILGIPVSFYDLEAYDDRYYKSLMQLLTSPLADLQLELFFAIETSVKEADGSPQLIDLVENGRSIPVDDSNKVEYVRLLAHHRLSSAFRKQVTTPLPASACLTAAVDAD